MSYDRPQPTSRMIEVTCYGLVLAYFGLEAWNWAGLRGRDTAKAGPSVVLQRQMDEIRAEVKELRQEIDRLKTPETQRQPVE